MQHYIDWEKLARYMAGECAAEEAAEIEAWIAADPMRQNLLDDLSRVWASTERTPRSWDVEGAWSRVQSRIAAEPEKGPLRQAADRLPSPSVRSRQATLGLLSRVVAVIGVVALTALLTLEWVKQPATPGPDAPEIRTFRTERGQRATLQLSDGTRVHLNVDSRMTAPLMFATDGREVSLEGEAYFEVAPDPERPFRIRTTHGLVQVLGTAFDLRAYADDATVQVVVTEGKVSLRPHDRPVEAGALLTAHQMGRLARDGRIEVVSNVAVDPYRSWTSGRLIFDKTPFGEVVDRLERWYDVEIHLADASLARPLFTTTLENVSLNMALNIISITLDLRYERDGREITFHPAPSAGS